MISDSERRRLGEIELSLRRDDPALVRQFDDWRLGPHQRPILAILVALAVVLTWVLYGTAAGVIALVGTACIGVAVIRWRGRGHRRGRGRPTGLP